MDITPLLLHNQNSITGYNSNGVKVNNKLINYDIILSPQNLLIWQNQLGIDDPGSYTQIIEEIENQAYNNNLILIIGTGSKYVPNSQLVRALFKKYNLAPEIMSTSNACHTYNVLITEGRVVYAMLVVQD
ncbi:Mth938-like domain-containing protein [Candidatus Trichorickettsia mobilis]|uniref:Mth938-like domain-containing protein n=1 Tax=Candidatus Trichorickettsia mobilis TaxID=1346319 RepID=UPI002931ABCD|nr:Mth938-like domain-containing protein [Candidatus Trichorickettsia mobilis]